MARAGRTTLAVAAMTALAAGTLAGTAAPSTASSGCKATPGVLSHAPKQTFTLPSTTGTRAVTVRVWDTGRLSSAMAQVRIVAIRIPVGSLKPRVLTAPTIDTTRTPRQLGSAVRDAVVVINGGVFDAGRNGVPVESQIVHGRIRKATRTPDTSLAIWGSQSHLDLPVAALAGSVTIGSRHWVLGSINWQSLPSTGVAAYTSDWGRSSHPGGSYAVVVADGKVVAKRSGSATHRPVGRNQTLVTARSSSVAAALAHVKVGTRASISMREVGHTQWDPWPHMSMPSPTDLIMGGSGLVTFGNNRVTRCSGRSEVLRPRSAIGTLPDGDILVVSITGAGSLSGAFYGGATDHQAADYMRQLGATTAAKLDGGTSTTLMIRKTVGGPLIRMDHPASAYMRPTPDSLSFVVT
jgi:hypothetical protein